jgi:acetyl-CoA/propionyl-CoA carboxylase biotin carboxyl carrier protein
LLLERLIRPARHIEVQILGDVQGHIVALLERECSLQRRHQKVIEECPSSSAGADLRGRLSDAACRLATAAGYTGAGTVEFLVEEDGRFWFLEMNTRLQVEHGVTELVLGEDLVEWQIRVAAGEPLAIPTPVIPRGHAIEARVYAEDPESGFLPQSGALLQLALPSGVGIRVDSGVRAGQEIPPYYDPMIAKIMAFGRDREQARRRLVWALRDTVVLGVRTNVGYLAGILSTEEFRAGRTFTHTLEEMGAPARPSEVPEDVLLLAAWALERPSAPPSSDGGADPHSDDRWSPFDHLGAFRIVGGGEPA